MCIARSGLGVGCVRSPAERAARRRAGYGSQPDLRSAGAAGMNPKSLPTPKPSQPAARGSGSGSLFSRFRYGAGSQKRAGGGLSCGNGGGGGGGGSQSQRGSQAELGCSEQSGSDQGAERAPAEPGQATEASCAPARKRARGASGCLPALAALGLSLSRGGDREHPLCQLADSGVTGKDAGREGGAASCSDAAGAEGGRPAAKNTKKAGNVSASKDGGHRGGSVVCMHEEWVVSERTGGGSGAWPFPGVGDVRRPAGHTLDAEVGDEGLDTLVASGQGVPEGASGGVSEQLNGGDAAAGSDDSRAALEAALARGAGNPETTNASPCLAAGGTLMGREASSCELSGAELSLGSASMGATLARGSFEEEGVLRRSRGAGAGAASMGRRPPWGGSVPPESDRDDEAGGMGLGLSPDGAVLDRTLNDSMDGEAGSEGLGLSLNGTSLGPNFGGGSPSGGSLERALGFAVEGNRSPAGSVDCLGSAGSDSLERALGLAVNLIPGTRTLAPGASPTRSHLTRMGAAALSPTLGSPPVLHSRPARTPMHAPGLELGSQAAAHGYARATCGIHGSPLKLGDDILLPAVGGRSVLGVSPSPNCRVSDASRDIWGGPPPTGLRSSGKRRRLRQAFYEGNDIVAEADPDPASDNDCPDPATNPITDPDFSPDAWAGDTASRYRSPAQRHRSARRSDQNPTLDDRPGSTSAPKRPGAGAGEPAAVSAKRMRRPAQERRSAQADMGGRGHQRSAHRAASRSPVGAGKRGDGRCRRSHRRRSRTAAGAAADPGAAAKTLRDSESPGGAAEGGGGDEDESGGGGFASLRHVSLFAGEARRAIGRVAAAGAARRAGLWLPGTAADPRGWAAFRNLPSSCCSCSCRSCNIS